MAVDLVIFDCDGVLIDSEMLYSRAVADCLAEDGVALSADTVLERYTGISWSSMLADLEARHGPMASDFAERHDRRLWPLLKAELIAVPGVGDSLAALRCKVCVASSSTPAQLRQSLSIVGLFERLSPHIFSAAEVTRGKPAPDLFLYAARRMKVAPRACIVVEDSLPGVTAAVAAGMPAIGFTGASHCRPGHAARLREAGAAAVIDDMVLLPPTLAALGLSCTV